MGLFSKIFKKIKKGVKGAFKSIGKGIKSAFKKIGKFMGKIGIVGQIALMFTPIGGIIGNMLSKAGGAVFKGVTGALAKGGAVSQAAGQVISAAGNFAKAGFSAFKTVTDGVGTFIKEFSRTALGKIPGMKTAFPKFFEGSADTFFKAGSTVVDGKVVAGKSAWNLTQDAVMKNAAAATSAFNEAIGNTKNIFTAAQSNVQQAALATQGMGGFQADKSIMQGTSTAGQNIQAKYSRGVTLDANTPIDIKNIDPKFNFNLTDEEMLGGGRVIDIGDLVPNMQVSTRPTGLTGGPTGVAADPTGYGSDFRGGSSMAGANVRARYGYNPTLNVTPEPSLLDRAKGYFSERYDKFLDGRSLPAALTDEAGSAILESGTEGIKEGVKQSGYELVKPPEPVETPSRQYVAAYEHAGIRDYGMSAEINDRAMQMSINPQSYIQQNPFGYGANIYQEQMRIKAGGTA